ncbi:MAG: pyruvate dehydrogenase (acetyl-transferring) E1 component subunit alpha [Bacteroidia bacterium]|nr:pyruvate dehydrogenase (acetyl-transferring) E1 component subunit alpha [Bacteroidia bacterium]MCX7652925.1 pyruvate dehydrogenase (acetyl-transferring) E1 component subunit alpha [Bacteroidia bacterium]MDW8416607.1 pyruvate dehydrogenase (acetyl-transferring) E1 component subunit alpha [Bacteroidia bacterium]
MAKVKAPEVQPYTREQLLFWYRQMLAVRRMEEKAAQLYTQQKIRGFLHLYIGQEATGMGIEAAIRPEDYVITGYREHGNAYFRGISMRAIMAELMAKETGCSRGKGGSMHMFSKERRFLGGHGIVGAQIGIGTGVAFAIKYRGEDLISVTMFGDGAARQGMLHESFNMAMLWTLPVLYICENNQYAMGTAVTRSSNVTEIYRLACAYDMPSQRVDGMSIFSVYEAVRHAAEHIRSGKGPYFLEIMTYRYRGHSMSDPAKYRTREEVEAYKEKDPIAHLQNYLYEHQLATEADIDRIEEEVAAEVADAVAFAEASPFPAAEQLYEDVYVQPDYPFLREW